MADCNISVDSDQGGRPDSSGVRQVGERKDKDNDERLAILPVYGSVKTAEFHHRIDAVQRERRHQQQVVHHRNTLRSFPYCMFLLTYRSLPSVVYRRMPVIVIAELNLQLVKQ